MPYLQEHVIGAVIRGPLQKELLTGKFSLETRFPDGDVRQSWPDEPWFGESLAKVERLRNWNDPINN